MRLDFLLIADAASEAGGKLYIHGAGITRLEVPTFPWAQPLSLVARFVLEDEADARLPHGFSFQVVSPSGEDVLPPLVAELNPTAMESGAGLVEGEQRFAQILLNMHTLQLDRPGVYQLVVSVDGREVGRMTLPVVGA
jgi:hypothetical protein